MQPDGVHLRVARHPLKVERFDEIIPEGHTVGQLIEIAQPDPYLLRAAHVYVGDTYIPREHWHAVKPKDGAIVSARVFMPPMGGGGGGGKNPIRTILTIAVIAAAAFVSGGSGGLLGAAFLEGTTGAALLGAGVGAVGLLLVNALVPPSTPKTAALASPTGGLRSSPTLFIDGARNVERPFEVVPAVLGRHKHVPPLGARRFTEIVGEDQYLRMLVVWGVGPLKISDVKIGDTPIASFDDVEIEHREGRASDDPITLFPGIVDQDDFTISLTSAADWQQRTSSDNADELSVDVLFGSGLFQITNNGSRVNRTVVMQIEYRKVGDVTWLPIPQTGLATTFPASWLEDTSSTTDGDFFRQVRFTHQRDSAVRHGIRWKTGERAQYEVRLRRTTADTASTQIVDLMSWTALRRFTNDDPIASHVPVARTALVIKATDQLNRVVDELNATIESYAQDYTGTGGWVEQTTSNPASLFRHVLQGNANANPLADSRIDLEDLEDFHDHCVANGYTFNMVRDFKASVYETLSDICSAARASPTQRDGKWGVIIDKPQSIPATHIGPRNSSGFSIEKAFIDMPHAWRTRFLNEDEDWGNDERVIYRDGFDVNTATKFETLDQPGVTNVDQIWKNGRYFAAAALQRPERWTFQQDMEHIVYSRGDLITVTHDVLLVGLKSGRIKEVVQDTGGDVVSLVLDEDVTMDGVQDYGMSVRTPTNAAVTFQVVSANGTFNEVMLSTPVSAGSFLPSAGDLFGFGLLGQETDDGLVVGIQRAPRFMASVSVVPYRSVVYDADTGPIPPFTTNITPLDAIPAPVITGVRSDETILAFGPGEALQARIAVSFEEPPEFVDDVEILYRPSVTGEPFFKAVVERRTQGEIVLSGARTGETWDIRMRFIVEGRMPGPYTTFFNHQVVGKSTPPAALSGLTISAFGGQAFMRWDRPDELDVLFGGEVRFRHSEQLIGASWSQSVSIGEAAQARTLLATLPLKAGTYLARVFDVDGNPSDIVSVTSKQASVLDFATVDTLDEATAFTGTKANTEVNAGQLQLVSDTDGNVLPSGTYHFAAGFNFGAVKRIRLTTRVTVSVANVNDLWDDRLELIDDWEDIDGVDQALGDLKVFVRLTDDDPDTTGAVFGDWQRLDSAEVEAWGAEFMAVLTSADSAYNTVASELGVDAEEVDAGT